MSMLLQAPSTQQLSQFGICIACMLHAARLHCSGMRRIASLKVSCAVSAQFNSIGLPNFPKVKCCTSLPSDHESYMQGARSKMPSLTLLPPDFAQDSATPETAQVLVINPVRARQISSTLRGFNAIPEHDSAAASVHCDSPLYTDHDSCSVYID